MKEEIRQILQKSGAVAVGFAKADIITDEVLNAYDNWIEARKHAGMAYMADHRALRMDPRTLLEGTKTVISAAFSYVPPRFRDPQKEMIACYAYGRDYHNVLRKILKKSVADLKESFGGDYRICIDSAPIAERYWAVKSGIGFTGCNGAVIVPGAGSLCFLAEILTTLELTPDMPRLQKCKDCGLCIKSCPGKAIGEGGIIDSRRCLSYLTIEHRGPFTTPEAKAVMSTSIGKKTLFGCDICLRVCPHNKGLFPSAISGFSLTPLTESLSSASLASLSPDKLQQMLAGSPLRRADWSRLTSPT